MAEPMPPKHGEMCWFELSTPNAPGACEFYEKLFGWTTRKELMASGDRQYDYHYINHGGKDVGGVFPLTEPGMEKMPPMWAIYIAVSNLDETLQQATALGGQICMPPMEIPVGRLAMLTDPQGALFAVFESRRSA